MCLMLEQMRNEAAEKSILSTWIEDAHNLMSHFHVNADEAILALKIPEKYRPTVLEALHAYA